MSAGNVRREDEVRSARERLIAQGLLRAAVPELLVTEEIEQSWRRSVSLRVDPAAEPHVLGEIDPDSAILRAAGRILDQWQTNLTDTRMALFLADDRGRIVSRRIVDPQDGKTLDQANAAEGYDFSERTLGTNGLGTPIESRGVVFVRGNEHFNEALARLACAGAPIKHPITGRILGSLSLASHIDVSSPLMVAMVRQAGHEIADALEHMADSRDLELARIYRRFRSLRRPVLVMNSETVMTDVPSLGHLDAEFHAVLWEKLRLHSWDDEALRLELPTLGTEAMVRRLGRGGQDSIFALEFLAHQDAEAPRVEAVVSQSEDQAAEATRTVLAIAPHGSQASPYAAVQRQLTAAAAGQGLIRMIGGPGAGKAHQAALWLRKHTGRDPKVLVVGDLGQEDSFRADAEAALHEGRGVVVVGKDSVTDELRGRLEDFALLPRPDVHPGARIILTERARAGGAPAAAGDDVPPVYVPSLADLRGVLPVVVREVAAALFPDAPAPRFSPAALQSLLAWPWPGNVAELSRLLAAMTQVGRGGLIQTADLPLPMRQTSRSSLSRYEQAERDTIDAALREAGGNKSRAAEILGIGRTTLYRKMRALKIAADESMISPGP